MGVIQCEKAPLPLPILEAKGFAVTGLEVNKRIHNFTDLPKPRLNVLRQASICLRVGLPGSMD